MLLQYSVENYKSIKNEIIINFSANKRWAEKEPSWKMRLLGQQSQAAGGEEQGEGKGEAQSGEVHLVWNEPVFRVN